jgi:bifunctional N-acetylglucosamine-1-phosphate-uridyltransferase/glucosamine-1-phosphate-acetyltransferase GlmU-like protein
LTDVPGILQGEGKTVTVVDAVPPEDVLSINTPEELRKVDALLRKRLAGGGRSFAAIVEQKDATPEQRAVREVNPSYYCFQSDHLFAALGRVRPTNRQNEYYLTDVPGILQGEGQTVAVVDAVPAEDVLSINTPEELRKVDAILRKRLAAGGRSFAAAGTTRERA